MQSRKVFHLFRYAFLFQAARFRTVMTEQAAISKIANGCTKDPKLITKEEWRKVLTPEQYEVTREQGTERPFSGKYVHFNEKGQYICSNCGALLFESDTKFDSHCGWPSFYACAHDKSKDCNIERRTDHSHGMKRVEVVCKKCDAHLGHVFEDGPEPTGERYCINSVSIDFLPKKD